MDIDTWENEGGAINKNYIYMENEDLPDRIVINKVQPGDTIQRKGETLKIADISEIDNDVFEVKFENGNTIKRGRYNSFIKAF